MNIKIAIFFSLIFFNVIFSPTIISLVHKNQEVSLLIDVNEDEEKRESEEAAKDLEIKVQLNENTLNRFFKEVSFKKNKSMSSKTYSSLIVKIHTPPPKVNFTIS